MDARTGADACSKDEHPYRFRTAGAAPPRFPTLLNAEGSAAYARGAGNILGGARFAMSRPVHPPPLLILSLAMDAVSPAVAAAAPPKAGDTVTTPVAAPTSGQLRLTDAIEIGLRNQPAVKQAR